MVDFPDVVDDFRLRVLEDDALGIKGRIEAKVHVFADGGRDDAPSVFLVEGRKIASPSAEGDSEWGSGYYHNAVILARWQREKKQKAIYKLT